MLDYGYRQIYSARKKQHIYKDSAGDVGIKYWQKGNKFNERWT